MDDWAWAVSAEQQGIIGGTINHWRHWGGRFTSTPLILATTSLPHWPTLYPLLVGLNFFLLLASATLLLRLAGALRTWTPCLVAVAIGLLPAPAQGLYWLSGAWNYTLPCSLIGGLILLAGCCPRRRWQTVAQFGGLGLGGVMVAGLSETGAIVGALTCAAVGCLGRPRAWLPAITISLGLGLLVSAPGNAERIALMHVDRTMPTTGLVAQAWVVLPSAATAALGELLVTLTAPALAWTALLTATVGGLLATAVPQGLRKAGIGAACMALTAWLAPMPSLMTVGFCEGRQMDTIALATIGWGLFAAYWLGRARPGLFASGWLLGWILLLSVWTIFVHSGVASSIGFSAAVVVLVATGLALTPLARMAYGRPVTPGFLALAALACLVGGQGFQTAVVDLVCHAPHRRAYQWQRDAGVDRLAAAGAVAVIIPFPDLEYFPSTISVGDLVGHDTWFNLAYAHCHGLESVRAVPGRGYEVIRWQVDPAPTP